MPVFSKQKLIDKWKTMELLHFFLLIYSMRKLKIVE